MSHLSSTISAAQHADELSPAEGGSYVVSLIVSIPELFSRLGARVGATELTKENPRFDQRLTVGINPRTSHNGRRLGQADFHFAAVADQARSG